ncbi:SEC14-like protein 2 [Antedon mediterranea]|uniref:SEC14-like protein 2 n=1 Tax=Antedon mediterranea TaxID=105859 RepID=UPI003AF72F7F
MSGRLGDLNEKQSQRLQQFKENVKDVMKAKHDDHTLLRFLRARSFDLKGSEKMFRKLGRHIEGMTYIMDLGRLGLHHLWKPGIDLFNQVITMFEQHYPETLRSVYIIKAPKFFPLAYSLVKPFLQEYTRKKIHVLGSNWKEVLLTQVDEAVLPAFWGGKATDPDGNMTCASKIQMGGDVPKSYYLKDRELSSKNLITKEISRGSMIELKYNVAKPGSVIRYEFKTHDHDIAFGIKRVGAENEKVVIQKTQRYNSHMVPEDGEVILDEPGQYVVKFDNTYSWTKTKTVSFFIELLEPHDIDEDPQYQVDPDKIENLCLYD